MTKEKSESGGLLLSLFSFWGSTCGRLEKCRTPRLPNAETAEGRNCRRPKGRNCRTPNCRRPKVPKVEKVERSPSIANLDLLIPLP